jgi:thiamine biosynthesis lipoprotein
MPQQTASGAVETHRRVESVLGTAFSIDLRDPRPDHDDVAALDGIFHWLRWLGTTFDAHSPTSTISRLGRGDLRLSQCPSEIGEVLDLCDEMRRDTFGYFDPVIAGRLDPGGLLKGWALRRASAWLTTAGWHNHCLSAGGDVFAAGEPTPGVRWRVGIADPLDLSRIAAVVPVRDAAVTTSAAAGSWRQVLNPFTARPVHPYASVTVIGPDPVRADAYATAAVAMGTGCRDWLDSLDGYSALVIPSNGRPWASRGCAVRRTDWAILNRK